MASRISNFGIAASAVTLAVLATSARAGLMELSLLDGTPADTVVVPDNTAGLDLSPTTGKIIFNGPVGSVFTTNITVGTSNSPGVVTGKLQLSSIDVHNDTNVTATLTIKLTDIDFNVPTYLDTLTLRSSFGGTEYNPSVGDEISFQSYADASNVQYGTGTAAPFQDFIATPGDVSAGQFSLTGPNTDVNTWFVYSSKYSMTAVVTLTLGPGAEANISGTTSLSGVENGVPEPASLGLLGLGALGLFARRRSR